MRETGLREWFHLKRLLESLLKSSSLKDENFTTLLHILLNDSKARSFNETIKDFALIVDYSIEIAISYVKNESPPN